MSLSGEFKYFAAFLSAVKILPPNPNILPDIECIGNNTRPLNRSNCLFSFTIVKPVDAKYFKSYPFAKAAFVKASHSSKQYPNSNVFMISSLKPRSLK